MLKSIFIDVFFETKNDRSAFDCWFESNDWRGLSSEEVIEKIDNFLEYDQYDDSYSEDDYYVYPIEDYTFGKNGNEYEYIQSVKDFLEKIKEETNSNLETE